MRRAVLRSRSTAGGAARVQATAVLIIGAELSGRPRPRRRHLCRLCPMHTSPIDFGWSRRRYGTHPRDEEREQGQCKALVMVRLIRKALVRIRSAPRRANHPDE